MNKAGFEGLPEPLVIHQGSIVENVFGLSGDNCLTTDWESTLGFTEYSIDRHNPTVGVYIDQGIMTETTQVTGVRRADGWYIHPWVTAAGLVFGVVAPNILPNVPSAIADVAEETARAGDWVHDRIWPETELTTITTYIPETVIEQRTVTVIVPEAKSEVVVSAKATQEGPNKSVENERVANELAREVKGYIDSGECAVTSAEIFGSASDDVKRELKSLGRPDKYNENLAQLRPTHFFTAFDKALGDFGITIEDIKIKSAEDIMLPENITQLVAVAENFGYQDFDQVLAIYNTNPDQLPPSLQTALDVALGSKRGVFATVLLSCGGQESYTIDVVVPTEVVKIHTETKTFETPIDNNPGDDNHNYDFEFWPIIIPPIPKFEKYSKLKTKTKPTDLVVPEEVWVELYPDVLDGKKKSGKNGYQLSNDAWLYSRKYQNLLREDRVEGFYKLGYNDKNHNPQNLRIMFVDHKPTPETLTSFIELMQKFVLINGGDIGTKLGMIAVFPSEQAGRQPQNPRAMGPGVDEQYAKSVLGVAMPALGLVEMHMPTKPTQEQIKSFNGAAWVLAHEIGGHFSDVISKPITIKPGGAGNKPNDFVSSDPWQNRAKELFTKYRKMAMVRPRWLAKRQVIDQSGQTHTFEHADLTSPDPRISEAQFKRKYGFPTQYSGSSALELWAETAAAELTKIGIPDSESGESIQHIPGFADTYGVDPELRGHFARQVGGNSQGDYVSWSAERLKRAFLEHSFSSLSQDEELKLLATKARQTPLPNREDMIRILTKATGHGA